MARDSCLARVTTGVAVGGAVGGAVGVWFIEFFFFYLCTDITTLTKRKIKPLGLKEMLNNDQKAHLDVLITLNS